VTRPGQRERDVPRLLVSIDTEEDQWGPGAEEATAENIRALPGLQRLFEELGVRPTYFVSYQVATDPTAASILREIAGEEGVEIGAHLHPWNTPPVREELTPRNSMMKNLPGPLQEAKLVRLTEALERAFGTRPRSFRAGRLGVGPETIDALVATDYEIDSSVAPFLDWRTLDDGPNFVGAPIAPYRLEGGADVCSPVPRGRILEVPISAGYTRRPMALWDPIHRALETVSVGGRALSGVLSRTGIVRKVMMSPEIDATPDLLRLCRALIRAGAPHIQLTFHSSTLVPGLSPFTPTAADVESLLEGLRTFVHAVEDMTPISFATVSELGRDPTLAAPA